ncbi:Flp pilus assembly protein TadB [uncultured Roseburia sp.]|uniref:Type II secretion system F family protein n=1 Tax=Brotonthovivens ammoniilytica TaxID=2981725 RepID=A0ABT2TNL1_9FIRM|nr:type II secretion system F family protein [Brotonthovivens ammoniilytica]MCU6763049.1 type II secretion system F family protein [Brotonthovivens ammoniilytica]SCJ01594.1 Flp pilus assembly protein TadB [uncultured Roseburia sp.]
MLQLEVPVSARILMMSGCGVLGIMMFFNCYRFLNLSAERRWIKTGWETLIWSTQEVQKKRMNQYVEVMMEYGEQEKIPWIQKWDQYFVQSQIKKKLPFLNSQLYGLLLISAAAGGFLILIMIIQKSGGKAAWTLLWPGAVLFAGSYGLKVLRLRKLNQTERELLPFLNLVDNFSRSEQDLFRILERTGRYLKEPLRSAVIACSRQAVMTGNRYDAVWELIYQIQHPKFQEIIRNLEICSRNEANYSEVLRDMRQSLQHYIAARREEKEISKEGRIQTAFILLMGVVMMGMLTAMTRISMRDILKYAPGRIIVLCWCMVLLFMIWNTCLKDQERSGG